MRQGWGLTIFLWNLNPVSPVYEASGQLFGPRVQTHPPGAPLPGLAPEGGLLSLSTQRCSILKMANYRSLPVCFNNHLTSTWHTNEREGCVQGEEDLKGDTLALICRLQKILFSDELSNICLQNCLHVAVTINVSKETFSVKNKKRPGRKMDEWMQDWVPSKSSSNLVIVGLL